jgi:hypothetical protein
MQQFGCTRVRGWGPLAGARVADWLEYLRHHAVFALFINSIYTPW